MAPKIAQTRRPLYGNFPTRPDESIIHVNTRKDAEDDGLFERINPQQWASRRWPHNDPAQWENRMSSSQAGGLEEDLTLVFATLFKDGEFEDEEEEKLSPFQRFQLRDFLWGRDPFNVGPYTTRKSEQTRRPNRATGDLGILGAEEQTSASDAKREDRTILHARDNYGDFCGGYLASRLINKDLIARLSRDRRKEATAAAKRALHLASHHPYLTAWLTSEHNDDQTSLELASRLKITVLPITWDPIKVHSLDLWSGHADYMTVKPALVAFLKAVLQSHPNNTLGPWEPLRFTLYDRIFEV